ncbi:MAG: carboxymuconolactone decarboxylase family protein [Candidatus Berkiella sp.]
MRISKQDICKIAWYLKPFFWNQKRKYGQILEPALVWARIPKLFITVASLYGVIDRRKSPLSPELRSLITVRVSQINWCRFCVDINSATLIRRSGSQEKCQELESWHHSDLFSELEKAALNYAEKITYSDQQPDDECFNQLKKYFNEEAIIELTALIAFQNMSSKFNNALDIEPQGFCKIKQPNEDK